MKAKQNKNLNRKPRLSWLMGLLPLLMLLIGSSVQAQLAIRYPLTITNGTFTSISGTGISVPVAGDDLATNITGLPAFTVNSVSYTNARMCSNGWIILYNTTAPTLTSNYAPLSSATGGGTNTVVLSPFGRDLNRNNFSGTAWRQQIGNELVFEWTDYNRYGVTGERLNFQVRLNTSTGAITYVYGTMTPGSNTTYPQVGWKTTGTTAANWSTNVNNLMIDVTGSNAGCTWANAVTGNANNSTMYFHSSNAGVKPNSGLTFTWTPQATPDPVRTFSAVSGITITQATIAWTAPAGATTYNVQYRIQGDCNWTNFAGNPVSGTTATLTGLTGSTTYQVRVQAVNGANNAIWSHVPPQAGGTGTNGYTGSGTFTTLCPAVSSFPFTETFETASSSRACWSNIQVAGAQDWIYATGSSLGSTITTAHGGSLNARFYSGPGTNSPITKLVSPVFDLSSLSAPRVTFWYGQPDWAGDQNTTKVYYRTSGVSPWVQIANYTGSVTAWTFETLTLPSPSATYQIAFEGINNWGRANVIDDVVVEEGPLCNPPAILSLTATQTGPTTANVSWSAATPVPSSGYEYWVSTSATPPGSGTSTMSLSATGVTITQGATNYLHVRSNCGGAGFSTWSTISFYVPPPGQIGAIEYGGALPINSCWDYSYSQQLYYANELSIALGANTNITKVRFYYQTSATSTTFNNWDIWMANTTKASFTGASDWIAAGTFTNVFSGTITVPGAGNWMEITLTTPFLWNGTDNIAIAVRENVAGYSCTAGFGIFDTPSLSPNGRALLTYRDGTTYDPSSLPAASGWYYSANTLQLVATPPPSCLPPSSLVATPVTPSTANLSWTAPITPPAMGYEYVVDLSPLDPAGAGTPNATTSVTGATTTPGTTNYLHVRSKCGVGDYSPWVTISFVTPCATINTFPFTETFENSSTSRHCWKVNDYVFGTVNWTYNTGAYAGAVTTAHNGTLNARFHATSWAGYETRLVSPAFNLSGLTSPTLTFWHAQQDWLGDQGELTVYYSNTPTGPWTQIAHYTNSISAWTKETLTLPTDPVVYLAFKGYTTYDYGVVLDDVNISDVTCGVPVSPVVSVVNPTTVDISWTVPGTGVPANGYEYWVSTSPTPPGSGTPTVSTSVTGVTATANVTNYLHVRAMCILPDVSFWVTIPFFTEYCPVTASDPSSSYYTNVTTTLGVTNINNNSTYDPTGYQNFTASVVSQYPNQPISITMSLTSSFGAGVSIYIDWNNDLDFNDPGEWIASGGYFYTGQLNTLFTVPVAQPAGNYRMRIVADEWSTGPNACYLVNIGGTYGEFEDYTVTVLNIPNCSSAVWNPTYTTQSDMPLVCTGQTVTFWSTPVAPVATNITYDLQFSTAMPGPYTTVMGPQANNEFFNSTPATGYYRVRTLCNGTPIGSTWVPVGVSISDPDIISTTGASNCGPGSVTLHAEQTPALATVAWYDSPSSNIPLAYGQDYTTPVIGSTTTYYAQALNLIPASDIGTELLTTSASAHTPYTTLWETHRTYYLIRKSELNAAGIYNGDISSLAFYVTAPGAMAMQNFEIKLSTTAAGNLNSGFSTVLTSTPVTVYSTASQPIPSIGWNTINFSTFFNWNGTDHLVIELCHHGTGWGSSSTVRYSQQTFNTVCGIYDDGANYCGTNNPVTVLNNYRPNMRIGAQAATCASVKYPVVATINSVPNVTGPGNQLFAPTNISFIPLNLTSYSSTPGATVVYTPASSIYNDALTTTMYVGGTDINGSPRYFAPLTTTTYSAVATGPNGCSASAPFTITVDASGLPQDACDATQVTVYNSINWINVNTLGSVTSFALPCGGGSKTVWFKATVPSSGQVHVVTKSSGSSLTDLTATKIALFTSTACGSITNTACESNSGPGDFTYAYTDATPGSTVYIRLSGVTGATVENGKAKMAVTSHLIWAPTNGDDFSLPENWQGGDATSLTTPAAGKSVLIPAGTVKPKLTANSDVKGVTIMSAPPYFNAPGIDLNSFTLNVKGNWAIGPVANASTTLDCNGLVEFNGVTPQTVTSGKTMFGNLTLNNTGGLTLNSTAGVFCVLKTTAGTMTTNGNLIIRSNAVNSAGLINPTGTGSISGNVSVERRIGSTSGYHYLTPPVSGALVNNTTTGWRDDFTMNNALDGQVFVPGQPYTQLATVWEYQEYVNNPDDRYGYVGYTGYARQLVPLKGLACIVPAYTVVDVLGPVNNGAVPSYSVTLTDDGKNLIGNPYPSPISWNSFRSTNNSALSSSGYMAFVSSGGYGGSYGTWDGTVGTAGVTDRIGSSQGIFAVALNNTTVSASNINRLVSAADVNTTFFGYTAVPDLLKLDINGNGYASQTAIYFSDSRSDAFDNDAPTMLSPNAGVPTIYSQLGNQKIGVNAMGKLNADKVVPLGVHIQTAGTYTFNVADMSDFAPSVIAYLEDVQTGVTTNLRTNPSYSVILPEGTIENRFYVHFHPAVELNAVNETCLGHDGKLVINYPTTNTVSIVVKDANGSVVSTQNNINGTVTIENLSAGNYVAEMTFGIAPNQYTTSDYFTVGGGNAVFANLSASTNSVDMAANTTVNFTATAQGVSNFNWNFGDGTIIANGSANVSHTYTQAGTYTVSVEAANGVCTSVSSTTVEVTNTTGLTAISNSNLTVTGVGSKVTVHFGNNMEGNGNIEVINMLGEVVAHLDNVPMKGSKVIDLSNIAAGQYMVKISNNKQLFTDKVYLSRQ